MFDETIENQYLSLKVVDFFAVKRYFYYIMSLLWICLYLVAFLEGCLVDRYFEDVYFLPLIRDVGITLGVVFYYVAGWIIINRILNIPHYLDEIWRSNLFDENTTEKDYTVHFNLFYKKYCGKYVYYIGLLFLILYLLYEYFSYYKGFNELNMIFCTHPVLFPNTYKIYVIINSYMAFLAGVSIYIIMTFLIYIGKLYDGCLTLKKVNPVSVNNHDIIGKIAYDYSVIFIIGSLIPVSQYILGVYFIPLIYNLVYYRAIIDFILLLFISFAVFIYPTNQTHLFIIKQKNDLIKRIKDKYEFAFNSILSEIQTESYNNLYTFKKDVMEINEWPISQYLRRKMIFSHIIIPTVSIILTTIISELVKRRI